MHVFGLNSKSHMTGDEKRFGVASVQVQAERIPFATAT